MKVPKIFKNLRIVILILFLIFALIAIQPSFWVKGVSIRSVDVNSSASEAGLAPPKHSLFLFRQERIIEINQKPVNNIQDYHQIIDSVKANQIVKVKTNQKLYNIQTKSLINKSNNQTIGLEDIGLQVYNSPTSRIKKGLDLIGGTRVLLEPSEELSDEDFSSIIDVLKERLNVYGLKDISVKKSRDLSGKQYILVEIAGATEEEVNQLLARQGKFEARVSNQTIFIGGERDVSYVCRSAGCSGIDPRRGCGLVDDGSWVCSFFFAVTISPEAAKRHAAITENLEVVTENGNQYLNESLILYLDDTEVDSLRIGAELKGRDTTDIQISGSGVGPTQETAATNTLKEMKRLQTILVTGSLPVKLNIVQMDNVSPFLGETFLRNAIFVGLLALLSVIVVLSIRYRKIKIAIPMALTLISELVLILGFAALFNWNLDMAAIAGIIIAIGTGVDHLIIITDETLRGEVTYDWKKRIRNAMFIIFGAFLTTCTGMIPLWFAGAGLLKGFAFTTIVGLCFGVFVARPAYAALIEILLKE